VKNANQGALTLALAASLHVSGLLPVSSPAEALDLRDIEMQTQTDCDGRVNN